MRTGIPFHTSNAGPMKFGPFNMRGRLGAFDPSTASQFVDDNSGESFYVDADGNVAHLISGSWVPDTVTSGTIQSAVQTMGPGIVQQASQGASSYGSFIDNLLSIVPQVMQYDAQRQLLTINLQRAKQGLPPIDASKYTPGLQVGVTSDTQKLVLYGIGIFAGAMVLSSLARRR